MSKPKRLRHQARQLGKKITVHRLILGSIIFGVIGNLIGVGYLFFSSQTDAQSILTQLPSLGLFLIWSLLPYLILGLIGKRYHRPPSMLGASLAILSVDIVLMVNILVSADVEATLGFTLKPVWMLALLPIGWVVGEHIGKQTRQPGRKP